MTTTLRNNGKIVLRAPKPWRLSDWNDIDRHAPIDWVMGLPFLVNPRGVLVHRVRSARTYRDRSGNRSHDVAGYWCGNSGRGQFTAEPPEDRLLCAYCEAKAIANGEKPADELVGRHVHIGTMRAHRQCCRENLN